MVKYASSISPSPALSTQLANSETVVLWSCRLYEAGSPDVTPVYIRICRQIPFCP